MCVAALLGATGSGKGVRDALPGTGEWLWMAWKTWKTLNCFVLVGRDLGISGDLDVQSMGHQHWDIQGVQSMKDQPWDVQDVQSMGHQPWDVQDVQPMGDQLWDVQDVQSMEISSGMLNPHWKLS